MSKLLQFVSLLSFISIGASMLVPNPMLDPSACGNQNASYVCDQYYQLGSFYKNFFNEDANWLLNYTRTTICSLDNQTAPIEVATAWIYSMKRNQNESKLAAARRYAKTIRNEWGIGNRSECDNGILIFLSTENNAVGISFGEGIRGISPDMDYKMAYFEWDIVDWLDMYPNDYDQVLFLEIWGLHYNVFGGHYPKNYTIYPNPTPTQSSTFTRLDTSEHSYPSDTPNAESSIVEFSGSINPGSVWAKILLIIIGSLLILGILTGIIIYLGKRLERMRHRRSGYVVIT